MNAGKLLLIFVAATFAPVAFCGSMYEWRDPATGKLKLGDKPPGGNIQYWLEGEKRPEEKADQARKEAEAKAAQERLNAAVKAESDKKFAAVYAEAKKKADEREKIREKQCTGDPQNLGVRLGMTQEVFRICFSFAPAKINTTTLPAGTQEQWVYRFSGSDIRYFYFTDGILTAMQN